MRVLCLSDLYWNAGAKQIKLTDIDVFNTLEQVPQRERFRHLLYYLHIIESHEPDVVVIAGDITGDNYLSYPR